MSIAQRFLSKLSSVLSRNAPFAQLLRSASPLVLTPAIVLAVAGPALSQERFQRRRFTLNRFEEGGRSITQTRRLMPDQRRLPRSFQRQTHRGWEVRTAQYEIVAPNQELAETAAAEFERGWSATQAIAAGLGRDTKSFGFAQRSVVVFIDGDQKALPRENRQWANQDQYVIQVRGDFESQHAHSIRAAASRSFLSASEWSRELPPWFEVGLSQWVASQTGNGADDAKNLATSIESAPDDFRSTRTWMAQPQDDQADANRALVTWWLEEDGGRNAWRVFAALRDRPHAKSHLAELRNTLASPLSAANLLVREPTIQLAKVDDGANGDALQLQSDLYVMLRLIERERLAMNAPTSDTRTQAVVREFKNGRSETPDVKRVSEAKSPGDSAAWSSRLQSALSQPNWSVLTLDGEWVESSQSERIARRLSQQPTIQFAKNQWTLAYPSTNGKLVAVWDRPSSPNSAIRFEIQ